MRSRFARAAAIICLATAGLVPAAPVFAQPTTEPPDLRTPIQTEIPVPVPSQQLTPGSEDRFRTAYLIEGKVEDLAQYIGIIYNFLISIVGLVAAVMMIVGGFQYLTSGGDSARIGAAKTRMTNAFIGLVLALGAYTILNSINPALLKLALPGFRSVRTQLSFLPWCEDLIAQGKAVENLAAKGDCGAVGVYKEGASELPCVYYGECRAATGTKKPVDSYFENAWYTCLQTGGGFDDGKHVTFTPEIILRVAKREKDEVRFGLCTSCAQINSKYNQEVFGYQTHELACEAWARTINGQFFKQFGAGSNFWSYCALAGDEISGEGRVDGCLQMDINCQKADNNEDTGRGDCDDDENDCGCEGYDDQPNPQYARRTGDDGYVKTIGHQDDTPDGTSAFHLGELCRQNPCRNYVNTVNQKQNFFKGCEFEGEITRHITEDLNIDCRNL